MVSHQQKHGSLKTEYTIAVSILVLAGLVGMAAWLGQGDSLLWAMIETGLAWCL